MLPALVMHILRARQLLGADELQLSVKLRQVLRTSGTTHGRHACRTVVGASSGLSIPFVWVMRGPTEIVPRMS
ncbi:hypothetical protein DOTSEDRAFT_75696 [Dothistroma septosporum NZE10]|uniref:Uncharacterized protein n=1 Tax=Dothistroma septosporum (strain NZE10 / CBS 128990) TaxID=675120 RepID=N1PBF1_DOTSN|nr:hypothetical protein DOTSEDRAFT_75696 [Dothistroma septosporum NZE10]